MEDLIKKLIVHLGDDPEREGLLDTPGRSSRAREFLTKGYGKTA